MISKLTAYKIFVEVIIIVPLLLIETGIYLILGKITNKKSSPADETLFDIAFMKGYAVIILFAIALWKFYDWESVPLNLPVFLM